MKKFIFVNSEGLSVKSATYYGDVEFTHLGVYDGLTAIEVPLESDDSDYMITKAWGNGVWVDKPAGATPSHVWVNQAWVFDVQLFVAAIRRQRDELLTECDWTQLPDAPLTAEQKATWMTYRQSLRDLPSQYLSASGEVPVIWPSKPA